MGEKVEGVLSGGGVDYSTGSYLSCSRVLIKSI